MGDIILLIDELKPSSSSSSSISICRICHEQEFETCKKMESPCACSGTVKFAHRDCIQRWCNEKGNTSCEICLQNFKPGYIAPLKKGQIIDTTVNIRESLEVPRGEPEQENAGQILETTDYSGCTSAADRSVSCCKSVALIFTVVYLIRHLWALLSGEAGDYPFSLVTMIIFRISGILLPMYILIRMITAIQSSIRHQYQNFENDELSTDDEVNEEEEHHNVEIQS